MTAATKRKVYCKQCLDNLRNRAWSRITSVAAMTCSHPKSLEQAVESPRIYLHISLAACLPGPQFCLETQYIHKLPGQAFGDAHKVNLTHRPFRASAVRARRRVS
jgi:hypothetical protein